MLYARGHYVCDADHILVCDVLPPAISGLRLPVPRLSTGTVDCCRKIPITPVDARYEKISFTFSFVC
jgi:hypothetical protein